MRLFFLLDQGLPRTTVAYLEQSGYGSVHVGDLGMASACDLEILKLAENKGYVVVTLDADFHTLLALRHSSLPSIIRIRIEGLKANGVAAILEQVVSKMSDDLLQGAAITVTDKGIRMRRLPLP